MASDIEAIRRDHGAGIGVHSDGKELYGTDDATLKNIVNMLTHSDRVENVGELVSKLPESAIIKVLETRYRHVAFVLQDKASINTETAVKLGSDIYLDLKIMMEAANEGKNLYDETINATNYIGEENYQNIFGLLDVYQNQIRESSKPIPVFDVETGKRFDALEYIELSREEIRIASKEFDYCSGKSM